MINYSSYGRETNNLTVLQKQQNQSSDSFVFPRFSAFLPYFFIMPQLLYKLLVPIFNFLHYSHLDLQFLNYLNILFNFFQLLFVELYLILELLILCVVFLTNKKGYFDFNLVLRIIFSQLVFQSLYFLAQKLYLPWIITFLSLFKVLETALGPWFLLEAVTFSSVATFFFV